MNTTPRHTPVPWTIFEPERKDGAFEIGVDYFEGLPSLVICSRAPIHHRAEESMANGEFICRAVNNHDALQKQVEQLREALAELLKAEANVSRLRITSCGHKLHEAESRLDEATMAATATLEQTKP